MCKPVQPACRQLSGLPTACHRLVCRRHGARPAACSQAAPVPRAAWLSGWLSPPVGPRPAASPQAASRPARLPGCPHLLGPRLSIALLTRPSSGTEAVQATTATRAPSARASSRNSGTPGRSGTSPLRAISRRMRTCSQGGEQVGGAGNASVGSQAAATRSMECQAGHGTMAAEAAAAGARCSRGLQAAWLHTAGGWP